MDTGTMDNKQEHLGHAPKANIDSCLCRSRLQIEHGNVLVILSDRPADQLLLRQSTLQSIGRFEAQLGEHAKFKPAQRTVTDPRSGCVTTIDVLNLKLVLDDLGENEKQVTFMLSDGKGDTPGMGRTGPDQTIWGSDFWHSFRDFYDSDYISGFCSMDVDVDPMEVQNIRYTRPYPIDRSHTSFHYNPVEIQWRAIIAFKILFRLLEGTYVSLDTCSCCEELGSTRNLARTIANCAAYAKYNEFFPVVAAGLRELFESIHDLKQDVNEHPYLYLALSIQLRSEAVFDMAAHRLAISNYAAAITKTLPFDTPDGPELMLRVLQERSALSQSVAGLHHEFITLNLPTIKRHGRKLPVAFLNDHGDLSANDRIEFLAYGAFVEWLNVEWVKSTAQEKGEWHTTAIKGEFDDSHNPIQWEVSSIWRMNRICCAILKANKDKDYSMLGPHLPSRLARMFPQENLGNSDAQRKAFNAALVQIMRLARDAICRIFGHYDMNAFDAKIDSWTFGEGPVLDASFGPWEKRFPWDDEEEYPEYDAPEKPLPITQQWVSALDLSFQADATDSTGSSSRIQ